MAPYTDPINLTKPEADEKFFDFSNGNFCVKNVPLLSQLPKNVSFNGFSSICQSSDAPLPLFHRVHSTSHKGGFFGFTKSEPSSMLINSLGKFTNRNFVSVFRFKTWWSTQWVGSSGSDLQMETQWVMFDVPEISSYVLIMPIIEGWFRSAINPGTDGHVMVCAESGSNQVKASSFDAIAYVHVCDNPYNLMKEAYCAVRVHLNTFKLLEEKSVSQIIDKFGWCTWDAFYLTVEPAGVWHGVKEFSDGGLALRFIIIDDGWQSANIDGEDPNEDAKNLVLGGSQMNARLHRFDEGKKFREYKGGSMSVYNPPPFDPKRPKMLIAKAIELEHAEKALDKAIQNGANDLSVLQSKIHKLKVELNEMLGGENDDDDNDHDHRHRFSTENCSGMKAFTKDLRENFKGLDEIYVWQALFGAWGGVRPKATHLDSTIVPCKVSPGLEGTMQDLAVVKIMQGGIGVVHPNQAAEFYDLMHSHLSDSGITGVKVDVIQATEYVGDEYGGRVDLAKTYYKGISKSILKNFNGTGLIASMEQCNDFFLLGTEQISIGRVGDDFWFQDPNGDPNGVNWLQGVHMIHCAYNSLWMGQIIQPDWDMFQSDHICAKFHAGSRAICGGPVYVSDSIGGHNFDLLKKLVYPDGTIPKCQYFALPTRDCLFKNALFDSKTILKIWNFNKYGGVIGAFNCQGAGWDPEERRIKGYSKCYKQMIGSVHVGDIEWNQNKDTVDMGEAEEYAVYLSQAETLQIIDQPNSDVIQMTIDPSHFEIFSFVPIKKFGEGNVKFAPIGLTNMFNSGGTIQELEYIDHGVKIKLKGGGDFLAYSSASPNMCCVNSDEVGFEWLAEEGKLCLKLPWVEESGGCFDLCFYF